MSHAHTEARCPHGVPLTIHDPRSSLHCAASVRRRCPVAASQILSVSSCDAETMKEPSGLTAQSVTPSVWPASTWRRAPVAASHTRRRRSYEAETMNVPSRLIAHRRTHPVCPLRRILSVAVRVSHTSTPPSYEVETMNDPSWLTAHPQSELLLPVSVLINAGCGRSGNGACGRRCNDVSVRPSSVVIGATAARCCKRL